MILLQNQTTPLHRIAFQTDLKNTVLINKATLLLSDGRQDPLLIVPGVYGNLLAIWELPLELSKQISPLQYQLILANESSVWMSKKELLLF